MKLRVICVCFAAGIVCIGVSLALWAIGAVLPSQQQTPPQKADSILILKKEHLVELFAKGAMIRAYKVSLDEAALHRRNVKVTRGRRRLLHHRCQVCC